MNKYLSISLFISVLSLNSFSKEAYKCEESLIPPINLSTIAKTEEAIQIELFCKSHKSCFSGSSQVIMHEYSSIEKCIEGVSAENKFCGINAAEWLILEEYTASGYKDVNRSLWSNNNKCNGVIDLLNQVIKKVPNYKGWVFRGTNLPSPIRKQHIEGSVVTYKAFTSTSSNKGWPGQDQFMIYSKNGASIDILSSTPNENEVIFATDTKFKILKKNHDTNTNINFYILVEYDETLSKQDQKKEDKKLLSEIKETITFLDKQIKNKLVSKNKNVFNKTQFISKDSWKCEDGFEQDHFEPQLLKSPKN